MIAKFFEYALYFAAIAVALHHIDAVRADISAIRHHLKSIDDQLMRRL
jgi:hypothetical protein